MTSITADTNFYVSALNYPGPPLRLLVLARGGKIRLDISDAIMAEVIGVLRERFGWEGYRLHFTKLEILGYAHRVQPTQLIDVVREDPPDNHILECANEARSDFIISADKDLLRHGSYSGIQIMRAADFLKRGLQR